MSVVTLATTGMFPLSVILAGVGIDVLGVEPFFVLAGGAIIIGVMVALTQPAFRRYRIGDHFEVPAAWAPTASVRGETAPTLARDNT
jgi:hypothetical protein